MAATTSVVSTYAKIQRACDVYNLVHSTDGEVSVFRDHLARHLSSAVNIAGMVLGGGKPLQVVAHQQRGAADSIGVIQALRECGQLSLYPDLVPVPAVESLVRHPFQEDLIAITHLRFSDPQAAVDRLNNLLKDLHHTGLLQRSTAKSLAWQNQARANWTRIRSGIEKVFAAYDTIFACKVDLLLRNHVPKDGTQAREFHDQLMQGHAFAHAEVSHVHSLQDKFHNALAESIPCPTKLLAWAYVTSYSRITGPYTTAILLFDGASTSVDEVHSALQTSWNTATDGHGYYFYWPPAKCQWAGLTAPHDDSKLHQLLQGLECVAMAEMYVRPNCLKDLQTFNVGSTFELHKERKHEHA